MRSLIFLNSFSFFCPLLLDWGAAKRFSPLHWQAAPTDDMPPELLLWHDVDRVDWEAEDTDVLQLPPNRSTLDRPISGDLLGI